MNDPPDRDRTAVASVVPPRPPPSGGTMSTTVTWQAPLPPPAALRELEAVVPGVAERIVKAWEDEMTHRRSTDHREMTVGERLAQSHIDQAKLGLWCGFAVVIVAMLIALVLGLTGHDALAGVIGGLDLVGLAAVFVFRQRQQAATQPETMHEAARPEPK